jgi:lipopolysaccharide export system ATP-binding protein
MTHPIQDKSAAGPRLVTDNTGLVASRIGKAYKGRPVLRDISLSVNRG